MLELHLVESYSHLTVSSANKERPKAVKGKGYWTAESMSMFEFGGWQSLVDTAEVSGEQLLLFRIRGVGLFAADIRYHKSRSRYIASSTLCKSRINEEEKDGQKTWTRDTWKHLLVCADL